MITNRSPRFRKAEICFFAIAVVGCKRETKSNQKDAAVAETQGPSISFYQPYVDMESVSEAELMARIQKEGPDAKLAGTSTIVLPQGERVLLIEQRGHKIPIASLHEGQLYDWWSHSTIEAGKSEGDVTIQRQNWVVRAPHNSDPGAPENPWFIVHEGAGKTVDLVPLSEHGLFTPTRSGNRFFNDTHQTVFELASVGTAQWQLKGNFDSPYLCAGSMIWQQRDNYFISATKEFDKTSYRTWQGEGQTMKFLADVTEPDQAMKSIGDRATNCPGRDGPSLPKIIERLTYSGQSNFGKTQQAITNPQNKYAPPGSIIVIDEARWVVLSVTKRQVTKIIDRTPTKFDYFDYIITNSSRTWPEEQGRQYSRVYLWKGDSDQGEKGMELLGSAEWFVLSAPSMIAEFTKQRLAAPGNIEALQKDARKQLDVAEKKFAEIDSYAKFGLILAACYVNELSFMELPQGKSLFGLKGVVPKSSITGVTEFERATISTVLRKNPEFTQRFIASLLLTGVQSLPTSADIITANIGKKPLSEIVTKVGTAIGQTAVVNGLLSLSPIVRIKDGVSTIQATGVSATAASGAVMRWRKMSIESAKGIDNGQTWQKGLNLIAGSATQVTQSLVALKFKSAGLFHSIGAGGVLFSEIISGRSSPGMIIGQSIEIVSGLVTKNPLYRPIAITGGKLLNAYAQFQGVLATQEMVDKTIDNALALKFRQLATNDALIFMTKKNANMIQQFSAKDRNLVLATAQNPQADFAAAMLTDIQAGK